MNRIIAYVAALFPLLAIHLAWGQSSTSAPTAGAGVQAASRPAAAAAAGAGAPIEVEKYARTIRVACVGDSVTARTGLQDGTPYPQQLGKMLGAKWQVGNFGVSGATLLNHGDFPYQKQPAFKSVLAWGPDVVIVMLGTNDTQGQNWKFKGEFADDYKDLIKKFAALPGKPRIYICTPPPTRKGGNYGIREEGVVELIPVIARVAAEMNVGLIDMYGALKSHRSLIPDKVHPNTAGSTFMAKAACQALTGKDFDQASASRPK
ncbi:MAG: GDSL-type esterase/lipase family protein [Planctomycetaceae bacterium]|nr:GDSL-type esterase/lipase family protein [Planctomycetaceae bacterium]